MTSPRQRPGRLEPPLNSHEAALVGALTAFAKSPSTSTSPGRGRPGPPLNNARPLGRISTAPLKSPAQASASAANVSSPSGTPGKPIRHDSGAVPTAKEQITHGKDPGRSHEVQTDVSTQNVRPKVQKKPKPLPLVKDTRPSSTFARTAPVRSIDTALQSDEHDDERIPSTSSLVQMFERQGTRTTSANTPLKSPTPMRKPLVLDQDDQTLSSQVKPRKVSTSSEASLPDNAPLSGKSKTTDVSSPNSFRSARDSFSPLLDRKPSVVEKPSVPPHRRAMKDVNPALQPHSDLSPPSKDPPRTSPIPIKQSQRSPYAQPSAAISSASIQATYNAMHPRRLSALRTGDSLANAIVASSLASSRAPSPAKFPGPNSLRSVHSHHNLFTRTPSPHKRKPASANAAGGLRQTLRKETPSSADENNLEDDPYYKHKKKRHIRKHANKYHEGDRKRWRNAVTERERDRYEGVWAANKGVLLATVPMTMREKRSEKRNYGAAGSWLEDTGFDMDGLGPVPETDTVESKDRGHVHAFIVRDLWSRSRLPVHVLEEIWNLVDGEGRSALSREEFVVGMWLVDQRLKGRKLPVKD
ncbi:hypothetical protein CAC42_7613 [Sphaceloma murrayae]|uniref:EH domain-containing protein n=1 Tax=Sphaceloma murrayae TaxID=2082308 RepID=A0A2K1QT34_9PEZI|nr:hypothetical protein CAC42_7613 [Sphaceloma murrayae]